MNELWTAIAKGNLGTNYYLRGEYSEAIPLLIEGMEGAVKNNTYNYPYAAGKALVLARIYLYQNKLKEVKRYTDQARGWLNTELDVSRAHNIDLWQEYHQVLMHYYRAVGDNVTAWHQNDSLENVNRIAHEEYNAQQLHRAELQIKREELEAEQMRSETFRRNLLTASAFAAVMGFLLLFIIYHNRQMVNKNRAIVRQIKELQKQQEIAEDQWQDQTTFTHGEHSNRRNQLCITLRDMMLKDKMYHSSTLTRDHLAKQLGVNKDLFGDIFRSCFNMPFHECINTLRLKDAIALLEQSDCTIEDISERTGFGTVRTFQRQFQNRYNMSPKDYRKITLRHER
jgi:AraC-like DNA-binding protein